MRRFHPNRRFRAGVERVGAADVLAAAQRHLHPASQTVVVAGDAQRLLPELRQLEEELGLTVELLPLEGPQAGQAAG